MPSLAKKFLKDKNGNRVWAKAHLSSVYNDNGTPLSAILDTILPSITLSDNGKILSVVNGQWQLVSPSTLYSGTGAPNDSQGHDGDIYVQTNEEQLNE